MRDKSFRRCLCPPRGPVELAARARDGRVFDGDDPSVGMDSHVAVAVASELEPPLVTAGAYKPPKLAGPYKGAGVGPSPAYSFTASVVELECDPETGVVHVDRVWIAHDIGKPINRVAVEGQVVGGVYMALGEGAVRGADVPPWLPEEPVDPRVPKPDIPRDAGSRDVPRRDR